MIACGIGAALTMAHHARRPLIDEYPRMWDIARSFSEEHGREVSWNAKWTPRVERIPVDPITERITFTLFRIGTPTTVRITWPDGVREEIPLGANGWTRVRHEFAASGGTGKFERRRWLVIEVDNTYTLSRWEPGHPDRRPLGVYINEYLAWYPWHIEEERAYLAEQAAQRATPQAP